MLLKEYFVFTKEQRIGLAILAGIIVVLQLMYHFVSFSSQEANPKNAQKWLTLQKNVDSLKTQRKEISFTIYPFNPNFITDFKGYKLGMSVEQIDRLLEFRKKGKFVNSAQEFQKVTQVSDSLLRVLSPYFKFPDWVNQKNGYPSQNWNSNKFKKGTPKEIVVKDINEATAEDLIAIYGIGEGLSARILKMKESLGGFVSMEQMNDIWGLSPEVIEALQQHFKVVSIPAITKINVNNASLKELMKLPYFRYSLAREIITYRSMNNGISTPEDLAKIKDFPVDKLKIITLYLDF